jgi:hypothetical protein
MAIGLSPLDIASETKSKNKMIFWDITPCGPLKVNRRFGENVACHLLHAGFLLGLFFDPEDGDKMDFRLLLLF